MPAPMPHPPLGSRYKRLTLREISHGAKHAMAICDCECGSVRTTRLSSLIAGDVGSCGCLRRERGARLTLRHGHTRNGAPTTEWTTWRAMHQRCEDQNHRSYADYGGRGIRVCAGWRQFEPFLLDMGPRPSIGHQIERKDNDAGYDCGKCNDCLRRGVVKTNCVWATRSAQAKNRRERARLADGTFAPKAVA